MSVWAYLKRIFEDHTSVVPNDHVSPSLPESAEWARGRWTHTHLLTCETMMVEFGIGHPATLLGRVLQSVYSEDITELAIVGVAPDGSMQTAWSDCQSLERIAKGVECLAHDIRLARG